MTQPHFPEFQFDLTLPPLVLAEGAEAFWVDEIPGYLPSGEGSHWYLRVRKRELTTQEAIEQIARASRVSPRDVGVAGQKDRNAVTIQWMSVPGDAPALEIGPINDKLEILERSRHGNKLRIGHVRGNHFELLFSGDTAQALAPLQTLVEALGREGLLNYFGAQRFGWGGRNLERACHWAERQQPLKGRDARFKTTLYASVLQSEVFNRYLTMRRQEPARLMAGEVVRLEGNRSVFVVEDPQAELPRLDSGDIHATGPMVGPKCRAAEGEVARMEAEAQASLGLSEEAWHFVGRSGPGTRRDLVVPVAPVSLDVEGPELVRVRFSLPAGSYATQLAREITRSPWHDPLRGSDE